MFAEAKEVICKIFSISSDVGENGEPSDWSALWANRSKYNNQDTLEWLRTISCEDHKAGMEVEDDQQTALKLEEEDDQQTALKLEEDLMSSPTIPAPAAPWPSSAVEDLMPSPEMQDALAQIMAGFSPPSDDEMADEIMAAGFAQPSDGRSDDMMADFLKPPGGGALC